MLMFIPLFSFASVCKELCKYLLALEKKNKTSFFKSWRHPANQEIHSIPKIRDRTRWRNQRQALYDVM